ncbi:hypothetical protein [Paraburkholderia sediminicola]|uniref:hypothetical protein n=1 Tax=Paraburkholderia sediminicola TaxID=458836 RepID=UPI0038B79A9A
MENLTSTTKQSKRTFTRESLSLNVKVSSALSDEARKTGLKKSEIVRQALTKHLNIPA